MIRTLTEPESRELLAKHGIDTGAYRVARTAIDAAASAREIGFPVAVKVVSPDVIHKSDAGGIKVGLASEEAVIEACGAIEKSVALKAPGAVIEGYLVAPVFTGGLEVIAGLGTDPQFGPVVMAGLGGIFVEVLKDVAFLAAPSTPHDASEMIDSLKARQVFSGVRGKPPADVLAYRDLIVKISRIPAADPGIREIDLNPVMLFEKGFAILDARVVISTGEQMQEKNPAILKSL